MIIFLHHPHSTGIRLPDKIRNRNRRSLWGNIDYRTFISPRLLYNPLEQARGWVLRICGNMGVW
jgi:hypothetical protein